MQPRIVVACEEAEFAEKVADALRNGDRTVITFDDPMKALDALEGASGAEMLVTRTEFAQGRIHGVSLARMARLKKPGVLVLFIGKPDDEQYTKDLGEFITWPVAVEDVVRRAEQLLVERTKLSG